MTITIGKLLEKLKTADLESNVYFDFCQLAPTNIDSWRGNYSQAAIGWSYGQTTVKHLINTIEKSIDGRFFTGYKGGNYQFTEDTYLYVDNYGDYTSTEIHSVDINEDHVIIRTK